MRAKVEENMAGRPSELKDQGRMQKLGSGPKRSASGRLRRLVLLVDLIRNRLAALIDPCGSITRKLREAPFPLQSFAPQVVWKFSREVGGRK